MTKEQEEAIEKLEHVNRYYDCNNYYSRYELDCIETVLNMIKEKDKEINSKSSTIKALQCALHERTEERDRKDYIIARQKKQIDLMAGYIATLDIEEDICEKAGKDLNECDCMSLGECENCIKQYFKSKVEKE